DLSLIEVDRVEESPRWLDGGIPFEVAKLEIASTKLKITVASLAVTWGVRQLDDVWHVVRVDVKHARGGIEAGHRPGRTSMQARHDDRSFEARRVESCASSNLAQDGQDRFAVRFTNVSGIRLVEVLSAEGWWLNGNRLGLRTLL